MPTRGEPPGDIEMLSSGRCLMTFGKWAPSEKPIFCMNKRREGRAEGGEESGEHRIGKRRPQALASCAMRWSRPACGGRMPPAGFSCALATTATTATTTGTTTATTTPTTTAATTAATTATTTAPTTATTATTITYCRVPLRYYYVPRRTPWNSYVLLCTTTYDYVF